MSNRKRKGSGRPSTAYPPYAVGPEQAVETAMKLSGISDRNVRDIMQLAVRDQEKGRPKPEPVPVSNEDDEYKRVTVSADLYSHENGLNQAAVRRELDMRGYYCFPIKNITPDAMSRLVKNTNCEYKEKSSGMLQIFSISYGETEATVIVDRYSGILNMMCTSKRLYDYDELAKNLTDYFAAAGIFKDYTCSVKVLMKNEAGTDPLADYALTYPAVWIRGAWREDIEHTESLAKWYKGLVHFYITPIAAGTMTREIRIKNVLGHNNLITVPLADAEPDYISLVLKAVLDSDRMYRSTLNSAKSNTSFMINAQPDADGIDIKSFPLFRKPAGKTTVTGPFVTDSEGLNEILKEAEDGDTGTRGKQNKEELEETKKQLKKALDEKGRLEQGLKKIEQEFELLKSKAEKQAEELSNELYANKEKLLETEVVKKELEDKVAEYAGLLRKQKDTDEYEQILKTAEDENAELKRRCTELEAANEALKGNFEVIKQKDVRGEALVTRGAEKDLFPGEVKDFILSAVEKELSASVPETRRAHVLKDILASNSYGHLLETKKGKLKAICEEYDGDLTSALPELEKEGYYLKSTNTHPKVEYYGDSRYVSVVSATASDHRSGLNQISDMSRMCL